MKTIILFLYIVSILTQISHAQVQEWVRTYDGTAHEDDNIYAMAKDRFGSICITGSSDGAGSSLDYLTVKYGSDGLVAWIKRYNGSGDGNDVASGIAADNYGNVYVTGSSMGVEGFFDIVTIKYNSAGVSQWTRRYPGAINANDYGYELCVDLSGNVYVQGAGKSPSGNYSDFITIKYNTSGDLQWVSRYEHAAGIHFYIKLDNIGDIIVAGSVKENNKTCAAVIKYNPDGSRQWAKKYCPGPADTGAYSIGVVTDGEGNIYMGGGIYKAGPPHYGGTDDYDIILVKYGPGGAEKWSERYNGLNNEDDFPESLGIDGGSNVYIAGTTDKSLSYTGDIITIKYNSDGLKKWIRKYELDNDPYYNSEVCMTVGQDDNIYVSGEINHEITTIKYSPAGAEQWVTAYNSYYGAFPKAILTDNAANVYVAGTLWVLNPSTSYNYDYITIKYSQPADMPALKTESNIPEKYSLSQNCPNPFNPATNIRFDITKPGLVRLVVYDITGAEVASVVNSRLNAGSYNIDFDASGLPSGTYFYRITAGDPSTGSGFTETKKMILIK